jgi:hypothetical protein
VVLLARRGAGADHPSAALNIASLIETVADRPGRRVLNAADPDSPSGAHIAAIIAAHLGHRWREIPLDESAPDGIGSHPWDRVPPVVLDTSAAIALGYTPVGDYANTVTNEIDWLVETAANATMVGTLSQTWEPSATEFVESYTAEDAYVTRLEGTAHRHS